MADIDFLTSARTVSPFGPGKPGRPGAPSAPIHDNEWYSMYTEQPMKDKPASPLSPLRPAGPGNPDRMKQYFSASVFEVEKIKHTRCAWFTASTRETCISGWTWLTLNEKR